MPPCSWMGDEDGLYSCALDGKAVLYLKDSPAACQVKRPPPKPVPARARGRVSVSEAGFVQLSGLSMPTT